MTLSQSDIDRKWEDEALLLQFTQAERVRSAAQVWTTYITAFLGVIGLAGVSFVPANLKDVNGSAHSLVLWLGVLVILFGLSALIFAALASGSIPKSIWTDGTAYKQASLKNTRDGLQYLRWSRGFTFTALGSLLLAAILATVNPGQTPAPLLMASQINGPTLCGEVVMNPKTGVIKLRIDDNLKALSNVTTTTSVEQCPPKP